MNSSNHNKTFAQATLKSAACLVLLNAVLSGCASSPDTRQASLVDEPDIYEEVAVQSPVADPRRIRSRKRVRQAAGASQAAVLYTRSIYIDPLNRPVSNAASPASFVLK